MALRRLIWATAERQFLRPVSAGDKYPPGRQAASQVKEQVDRAAIGPLKVVEQQEQRPLLRKVGKYPGYLFEELRLFQHA